MIDINNKNELNLKNVYGKNKKTGKYFVEEWKIAYPILKSLDVISWLSDKISKFTDNGKDAKKFSLTSYLKPLQQYCDFNGVNEPSELLSEEIDERNIRLKTYLSYLLNKEFDVEKMKKVGFESQPNEVTVRNMIQSRIKSFYSARGKPISYGMKTAESGVKTNELYLTQSIIKKIRTKLESAEYRLAVCFQTQLGLRVSDVLDELVSGKYKIEQFGQHYFVKNFKTQKMSVVINYLFFTEELTMEIQAVSGVEDLTKLDLSTLLKTKNNTPIKQADFLTRLKEVGCEIGLEGNIKTHSFRKYFSSQVRKSKLVDDEFKEHLMGHTSYNLSQAYNNNLKDISWFYDQWLKLENLICVDCVIYDKTSKKIKHIEEEHEDLKKKIEDLSNKLETFQDGYTTFLNLYENLMKSNKTVKTAIKKALTTPNGKPSEDFNKIIKINEMLEKKKN